MALSWDSVCLKLFVHHRRRLSGKGEGLNGINKDKTSSNAFVRVSHIYSNVTENIACGNRPITAHDVKQKLVEYNQLCEFPELGFLV